LGIIMSARILVVDDEEAFARMLQTLLEAYAYKVVTASCAREAVAALNAGCFDIMFTDIKMETDSAGYEVIRAARAIAHPPAVVIFTACPLPGDVDVDAAISKPARLDVLLQLISDLLQKRALPARTG
jgi:CheY-like chemotaxis protein